MKLLTKYNRVNILATIIVLLIAGLCYYFILKFVLINQLDNDLTIEEQEITDYVAIHNTLPLASNYKDLKILFEPTDEKTIKRKIKSVAIHDEDDDDEKTPGRQLIFSIMCAGKNYKVVITKSQQETEDLVQMIVLLTLAIVLFLLIVLFTINRFVLNKLWLPFNNTLLELKAFNLNNQTSVKLNHTTITEFKELNDAVSKMSNQVVKDYEALKSFTENASHEIQTPLAIVNSKLELLIQSENFTETQMQDIQTIQEEIHRLSRLNQSLLLLTKIENQQFHETEQVDIIKIINKLLNNYEELIAAKQITLTKNFTDTFTIEMNETMAQVLVSNLITNAIKHNIEQGIINIQVTKETLSVSNSGAMLKSKPGELFGRFKKDTLNADSLGLGLSIVKKICDRYGFKIAYNYENGFHTITILFS